MNLVNDRSFQHFSSNERKEQTSINNGSINCSNKDWFIEETMTDRSIDRSWAVRRTCKVQSITQDESLNISQSIHSLINKSRIHKSIMNRSWRMNGSICHWWMEMNGPTMNRWLIDNKPIRITLVPPFISIHQHYRKKKQRNFFYHFVSYEQCCSTKFVEFREISRNGWIPFCEGFSRVNFACVTLPIIKRSIQKSWNFCRVYSTVVEIL